MPNLLNQILKFLSDFFAPLAAYLAGRGSVKAEHDGEDAEVLKRQRDNNVDSVDDANSVWDTIRKNNK